MNMAAALPDPVRVEVAKSAPSLEALAGLLLSALSVVIALIAVFFSVWTWWRSGVRVRAGFTSNLDMVRATNVSRALSTDVHDVWLEVRRFRWGSKAQVNPNFVTAQHLENPDHGNGLPFALPPGSRLVLPVKDGHGKAVRGDASTWVRSEDRKARWVRPVIEHGHGTARGPWLRVPRSGEDSSVKK